MPHTLSGKRLEVPIKKLVRGTPLAKAANIASVDDPDSPALVRAVRCRAVPPAGLTDDAAGSDD